MDLNKIKYKVEKILGITLVGSLLCFIIVTLLLTIVNIIENL